MSYDSPMIDFLSKMSDDLSYAIIMLDVKNIEKVRSHLFSMQESIRKEMQMYSTRLKNKRDKLMARRGKKALIRFIKKL